MLINGTVGFTRASVDNPSAGDLQVDLIQMAALLSSGPKGPPPAVASRDVGELGPEGAAYSFDTDADGELVTMTRGANNSQAWAPCICGDPTRAYAVPQSFFDALAAMAANAGLPLQPMQLRFFGTVIGLTAESGVTVVNTDQDVHILYPGGNATGEKGVYILVGKNPGPPRPITLELSNGETANGLLMPGMIWHI
ncbi:MAG: hypothetical protein AAF570_01740 [Bacteroidota bacterium]